jgi:hypothetical protein
MMSYTLTAARNRSDSVSVVGSISAHLNNTDAEEFETDFLNLVRKYELKSR